MKKSFLLFIISCATAIVGAQSITPQLIADIRNVSEVALSPDVKTVAYVLRVPGEDYTGMQKSCLMLVPVEGGVTELLLDAAINPGSVSWRSDGKSFYYLAKDTLSKNTRLYAMDIDTREIKSLTNADLNVKKYSVSPDGKTIALVIADGKTDHEKADEKMRKDWIVLGENPKFDRLYTIDAVNPSTPKKLFETNLHVTDFIWSIDNTVVIFKAADQTTVDATMMYESIYRIDVNSPFPQKICETAGKLGNMAISPDGRELAFCSAVDISDPLAQSVFLVPVYGGDTKNLTLGYESSATDVKWIDRTTVLVLSAEGCFSSLRKINITDMKATVIYNKGVIVRSMDMNETSGVIAFSASSPQNPNEVYIGNTTTGVVKKLTNSNIELQNIKLTKQEVVSWKAADGLIIEGILTYPKDYVAGKKFPLLLQIHGGPEGVSSNGWNTRAVYPVQWYAANGYFVLEPNYRGSQGRGVKFTKADQKDLAGKEFEDVLAGIDYLVAKGMVDNNKVGTGGFSYGGYFSAWAATKYSQRFKAAMMGAGISNWISFCGTTEIIHENSLVHWNLWWYDHMDLVWDRSPLAHINNAKTPMLIVHGSADTRVPVTQSEEMYNALSLKKVPVQYVSYKRQPHGILEREAQIDYMNRTLKWFNTYMK